MGSHAVVLPPPPLDQNLLLLQRVEDLPIQQLVAELAVDEELLNQLLVSEGLNAAHLTSSAQSPAITNSSQFSGGPSCNSLNNVLLAMSNPLPNASRFLCRDAFPFRLWTIADRAS